jgi:hypothetical protein
MDENNYSSASGFTTDPESADQQELDNTKANINRSPVLYLMRRRNLDFPKGSSTAGFLRHKQTIWLPNNDKVKSDPGYMYPNHYSSARFGQVEWIKFKDYKRMNLKWIQKLELVID